MHRSIAPLAAALCCAAANADLISFAATINGDQEVPATPSPATGTLNGIFNTDDNSFSFDWVITGNLLGTPTAGAHIHQGLVGETGPIVFGFSNMDGSWELASSATWLNMTAEEVDALFAGELYVNFHTSAYTSGEVRGQITLIPTPSVLALCGLATLVAVRRRR